LRLGSDEAEKTGKFNFIGDFFGNIFEMAIKKGSHFTPYVNLLRLL